MTWSPELVTSKVSVPAGASSADSVQASAEESTVSARGSPSPAAPVPPASVFSVQAGEERAGRPAAVDREGRAHRVCFSVRRSACDGAAGRGRRVGGVAAAADADEEQRQHRDGVEQPGGGLDPGGGRREVEDALEQGRRTRCRRRATSDDVEGEVVEPGQEAGLLEVVHAVGQDAGRDEDQQRAGPGEEAGEVDRDRAAVDRGSRARRRWGCRAPRRAAARTWSRHAGRSRPVPAGGGPQEQRGLEPLAADGEEGDDDQRPAAPRRRRRPGRAARRRAPRAAPAIQKIIQVTKPTATIDSPPPISSWASKVRPRGPRPRAAPNATLTRDRERRRRARPGAAGAVARS